LARLPLAGYGVLHQQLVEDMHVGPAGLEQGQAFQRDFPLFTLSQCFHEMLRRQTAQILLRRCLISDRNQWSWPDSCHRWTPELLECLHARLTETRGGGKDQPDWRQVLVAAARGGPPEERGQAPFSPLALSGLQGAISEVFALPSA